MTIFLIIFVFNLHLFSAIKIEAQIWNIDSPRPPESETLVLLTSGKVLKMIPTKDFPLLKIPQFNSQDTFDITYNEKREIIDIRFKHSYAQMSTSDGLITTPFIPTTIASPTIARRYFREARYHDKESQCFNRAMVWTYEWWRRHGLRSNKLLVFFTRQYIRRFNFEWWFHIAPLVHIFDGEKVVERVMDIKYSSGPLPIKSWTNIFMHNNPDCPIIEQFSDYADHPYEGDCFLQRTHMYTYQPADLQMYEAWNYQKNDFVLKEVQQAYREAMDEIVSIEEKGENHVQSF